MSENWDEQIIALGGGILQSQAWAHFQEAVGRPAARQSGYGWAWQAFERKPRGIRYLFAPCGPVIGKNSALALESIVEQARQQKFDFVRVEPIGAVDASAIKALGGRKIHDLEPSTTMLLDLSAEEATLRSGLSSGHRNEINGTQRRGITIELSDKRADIDEFLAMMDDTAKRSGVSFFGHDYYRKMLETMLPVGAAKLYVARVEDRAVAAAIFYDFNGTRYYAHAGAYQDLNRQAKASVSLVWQAILDARAAGESTLDFWGIAPTDDPSHPWAGFTRFKKAFGGKPATTIGTWDIPLKKNKYRAYSTYRRLRRMDS